MGKNGEPVRRLKKPVAVPNQKPVALRTDDEFDSPGLGLQWQWHANHRDDWYSLAARPGWLRLFPQPAVTPLNGQPNLLLQKFPARSFTVETEIEFSAGQSGEEAGLIIAGDKSAAFGIRREGAENWLVFRTDESVQKICKVTVPRLKLRAMVSDGGRVTFSFEEKGKFVTITQTFQAAKGKWIGAKFGIFCIGPKAPARNGYFDFAYIKFV
jgi:beta-xylosidase